MRSLLVAPSRGDLGVLPKVLQDAGLPHTSSVDIATGLSLANADLRAFQAAIVVLPTERNQRGLQAVLFEAGIAAGRGLPLLIIVPPDQPIPPAIAPIQVVKTDLTNREALSFHLVLFAKSLGASPRAPSAPARPARLRPEVVGQFEVRLALLLSSSQPRRAQDVGRFVVDLLASAGAKVEAEPIERDRGFAAAFIPGEEERLGLLVVGVKDRLGSPSRIIAERRLQSYVMEARAGLGLLLYLWPTSEVSVPATPLVLSMPIGQLLSELRVRSLSRMLLRARNEAVHRM